MNREVNWLCYLAVEHNLVARENIEALVAICEPGTELLPFAQALLDNHFITDVAVLQQLMESASYAAHEHGDSPVQFSNSAAAQEVLSRSTAGGHPVTPAPAPGSRPAPPSGGYPFNIDGFPDLSRAEHASEAECRQMITQFLRHARANGSSDVHFSALAQPFVRHFGQLYFIGNQPILSPEASKKLNLSLLNDKQKNEFLEKRDLDHCCSFSKSERYRTNLMVHQDGIEGSYRIISDRIRTLSELGFEQPEILEKLTTYHQGLILITGPASSGKTTTLASLVELINKSRHDHVITVEDPVEILIPSKNCNISQRELGSGTLSFPNALKAALREDPDIIVLGEMRDMETIEMGISAAETGHLVIGTLNTNSAAATLDRLLDVFPADQQSQIRAMLAESLRGVICQSLVPSKDNSKLLMVPEILISNIAVINLIRTNKTSQLNSVIETGTKQGMMLREDSFMRRYLQGLISAETALKYVFNETKRQQIKNAEGMP
ncbi:MAG: Twitching mobility protein [Verrucomicrobiota bacterium]